MGQFRLLQSSEFIRIEPTARHVFGQDVSPYFFIIGIKLILPLSLRRRGRFVKEQQSVVPPNLRTPISGAANSPLSLVESPDSHYK